jgi:hypothetical protein
MSTATLSEVGHGLADLLGSRASRTDIADFLDGLPAIDRVEAATSLRGRQVAALYRAVAGGPLTRVEDFVPEETGTGRTIIFEGRNSLPAFTSFQKRFARLPSGQVVGYNHQATSFATGPGYFVVKPASDAADVRGEAYFDYTDVPEEIPRGWPAFKPNGAGLSRLVYADMKDYMRKVATHVYVGEAYKNGKSQRQFFILARTGA